MPSLIKQAETYLAERKKWAEAGKPMRSQERIEELFNICKECEHFRSYYCGICGCFINKGTTFNKLAWSSTRCPLEQISKIPKWFEEDDFNPELIEKKKKEGDCGCPKH